MLPGVLHEAVRAQCFHTTVHVRFETTYPHNTASIWNGLGEPSNSSFTDLLCYHDAIAVLTECAGDPLIAKNHTLSQHLKVTQVNLFRGVVMAFMPLLHDLAVCLL